MNPSGLYFMKYKMDLISGGMTKAMLRRACMLSKHYEEIGLITFDFNPDYEYTLSRLKQAGLWQEGMKLYNLYEFLMGDCSRSSKAVHLHPPEEPGYIIRKDRKREGVYYCYRQGRKEKVKGYQNGQLQWIEYFGNGRSRDMRELYDREGRLRKRTCFHLKTKRVIWEWFFRPDGVCFLSCSYDAKTGKVKTCIWYNERNEVRKSFKSMRQLRDYVVQGFLRQREQPVVVADGRFAVHFMLGLKHPDVAKAAVLHSNHLQFPYEYGSSLVPGNEAIFTNLQRLDALIVLTERQAEDIRRRFGPLQTIHTIGHPVPAASALAERDPYKVVMAARYEGIKQIPHAIQAMRQVVRQVPQAKLEIWGFGEQEWKYKRLIRRLGLQEHVQVKGFTADIGAVYRQAAFSISTSKSEAFGMSLAESMNEGTPVISYNCKYGPADLIEHERNGLLIPGNRQTLAAAMIDLFANKDKTERLGLEAKASVSRLTEERVAEAWLQVLAEARLQQTRRVQLQNVEAICSFVQYEAAGITVKGHIRLPEKEATALVREHLQVGLQLRRHGELLDVHVPLTFFWDGHTVRFQGSISQIPDMERGRWLCCVSCTCLNFQQFVPLRLEEPVKLRVHRIQKAVVRVMGQHQYVHVRVYRSGIEQKQKMPQLLRRWISRYKAKVRDFIREARAAK
ncbi:glycosyltransferase [Ectobacillus ponti]|uniref:Glycosyltransferase n=1 Tax=Ectobacillus ponti TaxID=2961894 RepID=A0AA42BRX4_9BACI|nr:glycosyltransferase [Ectobacillus ponti]MCP8969969.1 glycosyltransferase [Ectobacillus ponti]